MERVEDLYYKYKDDVYRYALSLSKDSYLAEELVQETVQPKDLVIFYL